MKYILGIDIGTSSTKTIAFDREGRQLARSAQGYSLNAPVPGAAEQNADEILQAVVQTVSQVVANLDPSQLLGLSFSAAMHTLLLLDEDYYPLIPLLTWADSRSDYLVTDICEQDPNLYTRTGLPIHPMSPVVKLVWLSKKYPDRFASAVRVVSIKEYVLYHLCNEWVVDLSIASTTGFLNLEKQDWDPGALQTAGIQVSQLSQIVPTTYQLKMQPGYAKKMNIAAGTPVIVGASDGVLANLGVGAIAPKTAAITLGTSGAVRRVVDKPKTESEAQLFCYALTKSRWVMGGAVNNGGFTLQWTKDSLVPYSIPPDEALEATVEPSHSTYERLTKMAQKVPPGSEGLIFHPHLLGARSPLWDAQARANFFGLGRNHGQAHLVRAVMEGVIYNLHSVFVALESASGEVETLRASGGFALSGLWQQILADVFNRQILVPEVIESSAFGAAVIALVALGEWATLEEVDKRVAIACIRNPIPENVERYQKILPIYGSLLSDLKQHYESLQQAIHS
ncbi:FGGY family of carbohydrate kinases, C-terminal domain protein [Synechococcus sp. PCC 7335]|uniref:gluconokinase n=1 Tax=Synechococcus sp. (strain ATCC 29403 / PCC 7335) TaxID=91464 RepID=UPI00017ED8E0|nr:gluconokinase [Synechococcus sp. PCC 7335]EDX83665.1 FGGY family of carbohydrate kinases, C-terminal domain protein [Synechococcus sp. PCC 7335]